MRCSDTGLFNPQAAASDEIIFKWLFWSRLSKLSVQFSRHRIFTARIHEFTNLRTVQIYSDSLLTFSVSVIIIVFYMIEKLLFLYIVYLFRNIFYLQTCDMWRVWWSEMQPMKTFTTPYRLYFYVFSVITWPLCSMNYIVILFIFKIQRISGLKPACMQS